MKDHVKNALVIKEFDNVATALQNLSEGDTACYEVDGVLRTLRLKQNISFGHKFAIRQIEEGEGVVKYSEVIGRATQRIEAGEHVHIHNLESLRGRGDWEAQA